MGITMKLSWPQAQALKDIFEKIQEVRDMGFSTIRLGSKGAIVGDITADKKGVDLNLKNAETHMES